VHRLPGVAAAVFPDEPERAFYNNALFQRDLGASDRSGALDAMEAVYATAGIARFAAWVHESDEPMRAELERRGYTLDITTRAMGMDLDDIALPRPQIPLGPADWPEYLRMDGLPPDFLLRPGRSGRRRLLPAHPALLARPSARPRPAARRRSLRDMRPGRGGGHGPGPHQRASPAGGPLARSDRGEDAEILILRHRVVALSTRSQHQGCPGQAGNSG
jgi:hypothetical protein